MTIMKRPITIEYDFMIGNYGTKEYVRKTYTADTYEDYHRVVRIIHENRDHYKVIKVSR